VTKLTFPKSNIVVNAAVELNARVSFITPAVVTVPVNDGEAIGDLNSIDTLSAVLFCNDSFKTPHIVQF
jgi:hypothetical protein